MFAKMFANFIFNNFSKHKNYRKLLIYKETSFNYFYLLSLFTPLTSINKSL